MPRVFRATSFLALTLCAFVAAGCGDPFAIRAPFDTAPDSFAISALTRTPVSSRVLWRMGSFARYRLDSIGAPFDLGFDLDDAGRITVYPARRIATPPPGTLAAPPLVGLLGSTAAYATADRAPETGYVSDTALVITRGQTVFVRSNSDFCTNQNTGGTLLYAKFVVDSVSVATRELFVRATIQPSCNFRSFATGLPTF
ncbi:MAG TPA: hypothetical protein VE861_13105 [Gemmatimonadaceae bacterium]|nr:hypothetical protein [Gemmatimonadaceae bacterium]